MREHSIGWRIGDVLYAMPNAPKGGYRVWRSAP